MKTTSNGKKRGRKSKPYVAADGSHVNGLRFRKHDNRWILADGRTFTESDESKAIERFRAMTDAWPKSAGTKPSFDNSPADALVKGFMLVGGTIGGKTAEQRFWQYVARQIHARPKWVAQETGIEQLAYLADLKAPETLPSPSDLETAWTTHSNVTSKEKNKVLAAWRDFVATAKVASISDITAQAVVAFRDAVYARKLGGKTQQHLFNRTRRMLTFARSRAIAPEAIDKALANLRLLTPSESTVTLDPKPIERSDWDKLLATAEGDDRAMMLLMLNAALYLQEVVSLQWSDVKGDCLVSHRAKTGRCVRIAKLWPETVAALATVKRRGDFIFYSNEGSPLTVSGAGKRFRKLRSNADVAETVTASQLRDGAYTSAVEANVNEQICRLLVGHRSGIADHYVKRRPSMVAPATDAVFSAYMK